MSHDLQARFGLITLRLDEWQERDPPQLGGLRIVG
jgi:hypothetical protein